MWVQQRDVLLWASIPCTGGSAWQRINCYRSVWQRKRVREAIKQFWRLWATFEIVPERVLERGGWVALEWPQGCSYWKLRRVRSVLGQHRLLGTVFHGCAYGLVSRAASTHGLFIKKPWMVATSCLPLPSKTK